MARRRRSRPSDDDDDDDTPRDEEPAFEPPSDEFDDPEDDRPWSEARWDQEMRKSDARADRFGELLETLMDDPDRDEKVAREMGWDELADDLAEAKRDGLLDEPGDGSADDLADLIVPGGDEDDEDEEDDDASGDPFDGDEHDRELNQIPAYVLAEELGHKIHDLLKPHMQADVGDAGPDDLRLGEAYIGPHIAAAKISGAHAMGSDDEMLGAVIVNHKRGLAAIERSIGHFESFRAEGILPADVVTQILPRLHQLRGLLQERIAELRSRVWW